MLMNTHFIISKNILKNLDSNKTFFLSDKNFIYGNINSYCLCIWKYDIIFWNSNTN